MRTLAGGESATAASIPRWRIAFSTQRAPVAVASSSTRPPSPISNVKHGTPARVASTQRMPSRTYMPWSVAMIQPEPKARPSASA